MLTALAAASKDRRHGPVWLDGELSGGASFSHCARAGPANCEW